MKAEELIKDIQKYINGQFFYPQLLQFLDKKKDYLLIPKIVDGSEEKEYNAIWDTIMYIESYFLPYSGYIITSTHSVSKLFNQFKANR